MGCQNTPQLRSSLVLHFQSRWFELNFDQHPITPCLRPWIVG